MTTNELQRFIADKDDSEIIDYFNLLHTKLKDLNNSNNRICLLMVLVSFIYIFIDNKAFTTIDIGFISISDISIIKLLTPLVFSLLFLLFANLNSHRAIVIKSIKVIGNHMYKLNSKDDAFYPNTFLHIILPFSFWDEINSTLMKNGKIGCLTLILIIPLFPIICLPFYFEYYAIKNLFISFWTNGLFEKCIIISNIWILLTIIYFYTKLMIQSVKEVKTENVDSSQ